MKIQIHKLYFALVLIIILSTAVTAGNIIVDEGVLRLEGDFDISSSKNSTTFTSKSGSSIIIDEPIENIPLASDSSKIEIDEEEHLISRQEITAPITGAVINSKPKRNIIPILITLIVIVSIFIGLKILKKNKV